MANLWETWKTGEKWRHHNLGVPFTLPVRAERKEQGNKTTAASVSFVKHGTNWMLISLCSSRCSIVRSLSFSPPPFFFSPLASLACRREPLLYVPSQLWIWTIQKLGSIKREGGEGGIGFGSFIKLNVFLSVPCTEFGLFFPPCVLSSLLDSMKSNLTQPPPNLWCWNRHLGEPVQAGSCCCPCCLGHP